LRQAELEKKVPVPRLPEEEAGEEGQPALTM
jgi:hypothetical protein